jgi:phage-related tail fiber protein
MPAVDALSNVVITSKATNDLIQWNGTNWVNKTLAGAGIQPVGAYLTANQTITLSGDVTGSGTTAITATLAASGVTAATYAGIAVNAKGLVTSATALTTCAGYGITDAVTTSATIDGGAF